MLIGAHGEFHMANHLPRCIALVYTHNISWLVNGEYKSLWLSHFCFQYKYVSNSPGPSGNIRKEIFLRYSTKTNLIYIHLVFILDISQWGINTALHCKSNSIKHVHYWKNDQFKIYYCIWNSFMQLVEEMIKNIMYKLVKCTIIPFITG